MGLGLQLYQQQKEQIYKVEMNRLYHHILDTNQMDDIDYTSYEYIKNITFLDVHENDKTTIQAFYSENAPYEHIIQPWYQQHQLIGYLKFAYELPAMNTHQMIWISEISLFLLQMGILCILLFLRSRLIRPFYQLQTLPEEMAKGHYKGEIKEEKTRYLGRYLWGMSQLQDALHISKVRQLKLEKEKKETLLSLSHDIKTPLNLIKLYTKAIEDNVYDNTQDQQHALHQIGVKAEEIERYIDTIMKTSREEIIDIQTKHDEFYLQPFIEKLRKQFEEACAIQNIEFVMGPYEEKLLHADQDRLQEVFENLFDNACKYGNGKRIEITFYEEDYCQLIRFFNTGEQINDTDANHLFESFYRGSNANGKQGSGLGLYICKEILRKMDSEIFLQQESIGTAFIIVLH